MALVERIDEASTLPRILNGRNNPSSLIDMKLHLAGDTLIDPTAFERETLKITTCLKKS
jgi:peptidyl-dipeptidase Dcp